MRKNAGADMVKNKMREKPDIYYHILDILFRLDV